MVLKLTRPFGGQGPNLETSWFQQIGGVSLLDIHTIEDGLIICRVARDFFDQSRIWGMWRTIGLVWFFMFFLNFESAGSHS